MTFKEKCTNKSVYVVPPLAALIKIRSWGAPILFFAAWCTQNLISLTTTVVVNLKVRLKFFFVKSVKSHCTFDSKQLLKKVLNKYLV